MGQDPPPPNGYERRKQRKRAQILAAATEIFRRQGISRVSVAQIADHAGVSQVTIYNHFGDKAGLVEAVLVGVAEQRIEAYREILKADAPWSERLARVVRDKRRLLRDLEIPVDIIVVGQAFAERYGDIPGSVLYPAFREGTVLYG